MADVRAFQGVRYDVAQVGALSDVVAPPYDVIDPALQEKLYQASPYNSIRMELNKPEPGDSEGESPYTRAGRFLRDWQRRGVLRTEEQSAFYVYEQTYEVEGETHVRKGFFARVRLEPFGEGKIFPHEQTLAGPKADRLALYQATGFNLSPIFGLYPDAANEVLRKVEEGIRDKTPLIAEDHLGVVNKLWLSTDPEVLSVVGGLMGQKPVFIADGHHRYETGLRFRNEKEAAGELTGPEDPANFCLMMLVSMSDPGLLILPTHRLAKGFPGLTAEELASRLGAEFETTVVGEGDAGLEAAAEATASSDEQDVLAFGTVADGKWTVARLRSDAIMDKLAADHGAEWRSLGVSILQVLVLDHLLASLAKDRSVRYVHLAGEVRDDVAAKGCDLACLVPPASMEHVEAIASALETMPPKSTYFYPKLLTGLVFNPIR
ncbi:DUF1015 domain-containing protein [Paludisphaera mucosa]|uniref:DUF1015 domain-containing protein n=1 Tax=Paludisphaera mucosa TaxID=3030827 RepID=A0ABT6FHD9_9BACT|nr:DUF1015 domain-containing protein [Paludisphaera mucosa]MDG3007006.1 DUF1015 domain-containing protein [Paludisphaera mucosa]